MTAKCDTIFVKTGFVFFLVKEIKISIKLKQRYRMFLEDTNSPEFRELSGNVEQAVSEERLCETSSI